MFYFTAWLSVDLGNQTDIFWHVLAIAWYLTKTSYEEKPNVTWSPLGAEPVLGMAVA